MMRREKTTQKSPRSFHLAGIYATVAFCRISLVKCEFNGHGYEAFFFFENCVDGISTILSMD